MQNGGGLLDTVKDFVIEHKTGLAITGGGAALLTIGLAMKPKKGNMIKPILTGAGVIAAGFGLYKTFVSQ